VNALDYLDELPDGVVDHARGAIDPLEIAANLEAAGISNRVARDQHGVADVFAMADRLWCDVPFAPEDVEPEEPLRSGNISDLGRGAVYGAPGLLLYALQSAIGWKVPTWVLAVAVTWGWGLGQLVAGVAYAARSRHDDRGERVLHGWMLLASPLSTAAVIALCSTFAAAPARVYVVAAGLTAYMVATAVLVLRDRILVAALCLVPGAIGAVVGLVDDAARGTFVAVAVLLSLVASLVAASWFVTLFGSVRGVLGRGEFVRSLAHLVHGLLCGAALAVVVLAGGALVHRREGLLAVSTPLVVSLGVMEWQLRTFRSGARRLQSLTSLADYTERTRRLFVRCQLVYALSTLTACAVAALAAGSISHVGELGMIGTAGLLGCVYHLDVTLVSLGRVDLALRGWVVGGLVGGVAAVVASGMVRHADLVFIGSLAGLAVCVASLWALAQTPVCTAVSH
jgi:hypothetical protein